MSKQEENRNDIEENPTDKILEKIEQDKRKVKKSAVLAFAALIAIIALGIAWFVSNTKVTGTSSSVAASTDVPFLLGSAGWRQDVEKDYLKNATDNLLQEGNKITYEKYIEDGKEKNTSIDLYTGTSSLAWHLNTQESIAPGATGKLEFYLIPQAGGIKSVDIQLNITGYTYKSDADRTAVAITNSNKEKINNLLTGHVLLFQQLDDTYGYSGWLGENNSLTVKAPNDGTFEKGVPYKVTLWWVWPKYFRNYIYTQRSTQEDLFTDKIKENDTSRENLQVFINAQKSLGMSGKLFLADNADLSEGNITESEINDKMTDAVLDKCSEYYNQADEFLGKNVKYIYVEMKVSQ